MRGYTRQNHEIDRYATLIGCGFRTKGHSEGRRAWEGESIHVKGGVESKREARARSRFDTDKIRLSLSGLG